MKSFRNTYASVLFWSIFAVGCSNVSFSAPPATGAIGSASSTTNPTGTGPYSNPNSNPNNSTTATSQTTQALKTMQPTLAVRGMACLMCHADIRSNIVTDFGYGNSYFMGGTYSFDNADTNTSDQTWYGNVASAWQSAQINGTVYVPDVNVTASALAMLSNPPASMNLATFMTTPYVEQYNWDAKNTPISGYLWNSNPTKAPQAMSLNIIPATAGSSPVTAVQNVVIRAPTDSEISALDAKFFSGAVGFEVAGSTAQVALQVSSQGSGSFVTNTSATLQCNDTDLLVNGTLFLNNLNISANNGCRIYVLGSVFIQGPITYAPGSNANLQITSTRAIIMGMNYASVVNRLTQDYRNLQLAQLDYLTLANEVVNDSGSLGSLLIDANNDSVDNPTLDPFGGFTRASIDFSEVLLNAPIVHSHYLGSVKGTIVAEAALFSLGEFHFEFDPVFTQVTVLPLLTNPILVVQ